MRNSKGLPVIGFIILSLLMLAGAFTLPAQVGTSSSPALDLSALQLVDSNSIPLFGNFYFAQNYGITRATGLDAFGPPLPSDLRPDLPLYSLGNGNYVIDDYGVDYSAQSAAMSRGRMMSMGEDDSGGVTPMFSFSTDGLWLEMTGVTNGLAYVNLHNATNQVYEILTKTNLSLPPWTIENEVWSTNSTVMPFNVLELDRTNLFVRAMDWTGVTENGNTTPDWWFWQYYGTTALLDGDLDSQGNTLLSDYLNGYDPNIITFTLGVTNQFVRANPAPMSLSVSGGEPFKMTVLVDDANFADAVWSPYTNSFINVNLGSTEGWHSIWIGLTGHSPNSTPSWQYQRVKYDHTPPMLIITNPVLGVVTQPIIELQGYCPEALLTITYDLTNAAGLVTQQPVLVRDQFYDTNTFEFTTNTFQAFEVPLTNGLNTITLHASDLAGNITTTNVAYTVDYSTKTNPPVVRFLWPTNGMKVCGSSFIWNGTISDPTATVTAQTVDTNGVTNTFSGVVGRDGKFYLQNLPLGSGTNFFTLTAIDVVGNTTITNLSLIQGGAGLAVDPIPSNQTTVTGEINTNTFTVWVNGVKATLSSSANVSGVFTWEANNVPIPRNSSLVQVRAIPNSDHGGYGSWGGGP
jgi:hypothetical protein